MLARLKTYIPTALLAVLIVYFGFHALTGPRGLLLSSQRDAELALVTKQLEQARAKRVDLQRQAVLLSDRSLSLDLLEERTRAQLGFADPNDYVIRLSR